MANFPYDTLGLWVDRLIDQASDSPFQRFYTRWLNKIIHKTEMKVWAVLSFERVNIAEVQTFKKIILASNGL